MGEGIAVRLATKIRIFSDYGGEHHETFSAVTLRDDYADGLGFWRLCLLEGWRHPGLLPEAGELLPKLGLLLGRQAWGVSDDEASRPRLKGPPGSDSGLPIDVRT